MKIPRAVGGAGDITGGLPRVTELLEARNPSNPAVVSEIDGDFEGAFVEVEDDGHLILHDKQGVIRSYSFGEVKFK